MMRSLSSAVAGLRAHQNRMDVIGNNIANVNTYAFKASRVTFSDVYYQTLSGGSAARATTGGRNPTQIGYGSQISTIDTLHTRAGGTSTDRYLDVVIEGEGFLVVEKDGVEYYTRLGSLYWDNAGNLTDYSGAFVQGYDGNGGLSGNIEIESWSVGGVDYRLDQFLNNISIGPDGKITGIAKETFTRGDGVTQVQENEVVEIGQIALAIFGNTDGLVQSGSSHYVVSPNSGSPRYVEPGEGGSGETVSGMLEMSNVDLSKEFSDMIVTQRGFQANSRIITVSDEMLQELVNLKR